MEGKTFTGSIFIGGKTEKSYLRKAIDGEIGFDNILEYHNKTSTALGNEIQDNITKCFEIAERFIACIFLLAISPIMLLIAVMVRITSRGDIFYLQERVGYRGRTFSIIKFRTMCEDAESKTGPIISWKGDPRITRFGQFLRRTHLDELPQLINVINGEMSFIGPRPERPEILSKFQDDLEGYRNREKAKPGITGLAQVCCGYNATPAEKLKYDLLYISNKNSVYMKLFIYYFTLEKVLTGSTINP